MRHASLFSGIGGFDLAAQWMGWENVFQVEIDKYCNKVLTKNFPQTKRYGDITEFDGTKYRGAIDILTGGFPCQPYSSSGKRKGNTDSRHLWPQMLRVIGEIQPTYIVGENVFGITNWNDGLVFEQVQVDMENKGYEVQSFILPACGVNAPHERARVWFIANSNMQHGSLPEKQWTKRSAGNTNINRLSKRGSITHTTTDRGFSERYAEQTQNSSHQATERLRSIPRWQNFPTQSPVCRRDDGVHNRVDRIKGLGNAVVPQLVLQIFKAINKMV